MFEFLDDQPSDRVVAAVYFAARLIVHRHDMGDFRKALPIQGVDTEPTNQEAELGLQIIEEIVTREKTQDIDGLSAEKASHYVSRLVRLAEDRLLKDLGTTKPGRSREILERWRRDGARPAVQG